MNHHNEYIKDLLVAQSDIPKQSNLKNVLLIKNKALF
jgi:hypothetical protein